VWINRYFNFRAGMPAARLLAVEDFSTPYCTALLAGTSQETRRLRSDGTIMLSVYRSGP